MTLKVSDFQPRQRSGSGGSARVRSGNLTDGMRRRLEEAKVAVGQPFIGVTIDGSPQKGLFNIRNTGLSTAPITDATQAFLAQLNPQEKSAATFHLEAPEWRQWCNIHPFLLRHGALLEELSEAQLNAALGILKAAMSPLGFETARNVMRLNSAIGSITKRYEEYGELVYWLSVMGEPSHTEPWGWQIDGHHLIVNCFVLGDQLVTTPTFMGSEPVAVADGQHEGIRVFENEESNGLRLMQSLSSEQRRLAVLSDELPSEVFTTAFRDNFELAYEGVRYDDLTSAQQSLLVRIIETYIGRERSDHAQLHMEEVRQHLNQTHFAWMGDSHDESVFYYRIHSPVILIEFDHQRGVALADDTPTRNHIHTIVRTPNGNDYGKDLLRQHRERNPHSQ